MQVLGCLLLVSVLPTADQAPVTIHLIAWHPQSPRADRALRSLCTRFQTAHPSARATIMLHAVEDAPRLLHNWSAAEGWRPELVVMPDLWLRTFADGLAALPEPVAGVLRTHAPSGLTNRLRLSDRDVAVPWWIEPRVLFYWPRLLGERDWRPQSWDEVVTAAAKASERRHVWGLGVPGSGEAAARLFLEMLWGNGGSLQNADGRFDLGTPAAEQVMQTLLQADREGACQPQLLTWSQAELEEAFVDREIAVLVAGAALETDLGAEDPPPYGVAPLPSKQLFMSASVDCLVALDGSACPEAAAEFLAFAASREGQANVLEAGGLPFYPDLAQRAARRPALMAAVSGLGDIRSLPQDEWRAVLVALDHALYAALSGRRSPARALEEADAIFKEALFAQ